MTSHNMLHILGPTRWDAIAAIVGDRSALERLRFALNDALESGSGGAVVAASDGEAFLLAIALQTDMQAVQTTYADEFAPLRSMREQIPLRQTTHFSNACLKAARMQAQLIEPLRSSQPKRHANAQCDTASDTP